jgi:hypothetical protein
MLIALLSGPFGNVCCVETRAGPATGSGLLLLMRNNVELGPLPDLKLWEPDEIVGRPGTPGISCSA